MVRPLTFEEKATRFKNPRDLDAYLVISPMPYRHEAWYIKESLRFL